VFGLFALQIQFGIVPIVLMHLKRGFFACLKPVALPGVQTGAFHIHLLRGTGLLAIAAHDRDLMVLALCVYGRTVAGTHAIAINLTFAFAFEGSALA
jgi:hypothetical protein